MSNARIDKPCPFCGCARIITEEKERLGWTAYCDRCLAEGPMMCLSEDEAIAAWNQRSPEKDNSE